MVRYSWYMCFPWYVLLVRLVGTFGTVGSYRTKRTNYTATSVSTLPPNRTDEPYQVWAGLRGGVFLYTRPETQVSTRECATCRMPYTPATGTKGDTSRTPVATPCHGSKEPEEHGSMWLNALFWQKSKPNANACILHPCNPTREHTLTRRRIEKQRCSNFMLRVAESTLQK